jgi:ACR3 family arsenite efflux pump ArsB
VAIGQLAPAIPETLSRFEYAQVSLPVAVLIWAMIFPMMVQIDFGAIVGAGREPKGLVITSGVNWLVKPFTMYLIASFFLLVRVRAAGSRRSSDASTSPARSCSGRPRARRWSSSGAT